MFSSSSLTVVAAALLAAVPEVAAFCDPAAAVDVAVVFLGAGLEVVVAPILARAENEVGETKMLSILGGNFDIIRRLGDVLSFGKFICCVIVNLPFPLILVK